MVVDVWLELQLQQIFPDPLDVLALIRTQLLDSLDDFHVAVDHLGHVAVASVRTRQDVSYNAPSAPHRSVQGVAL